MDTRAYWVSLAERLGGKLLPALAEGRLRASMPVEVAPGAGARNEVSHLEAVGRLLAGLAPWLELDQGINEAEHTLQGRFRDLALLGLERGLDPASPDRLNFSKGEQPLVDAAFLSTALLRAPKALIEKINGINRERLIQALSSTRAIKPGRNNWLLFSATVECALAQLGARWEEGPVDDAVRAHEGWYLGDGTYGDGEQFAADYYNSYVIQPMLLDLLDIIKTHSPRWDGMRERAWERGMRQAEIQERMISPEGTYPPLGRSICYRAGAFHHLAYMAWKGRLPERLKPAQVRCALTALMRRQMDAPGTFDADGWLTLGLVGHQRELAEYYLSTGSMYLATLALAPLGLGPKDAFWSAPDEDWSSKRLWAGGTLPPDAALEARKG